MRLQELFSKQASLVQLGEYEDELATLRILQTIPEEIQTVRRNLYLDWLDSLDRPIKTTQSEEQSRRMREEGNRLFNIKPRKTEDLLSACQYYTNAIFKAPPPKPVANSKSEPLALAYANRAMALQEYGYYRQAYDDCECALEYGYPENMLHKIVTRQAHCALKLKDRARLRCHLDALENMQLNASFKKEFEKICAGWLELLKEPWEPMVDDSIDPHRQTQEIVKSNEARGRYMISTEDIKENNLIFTERSPAFVPVGDNLVCQQCCSLLLVPYPCPFCNLQVIYCSLKCRMLHATIHAHECIANQRDVFSHIGIGHLAFRMVISGIPQIVPLLANLSSATEIWNALNADESAILQGFPVEYSQSLRMITHLGTMSNDDILWFALVSELLVIYLQKFSVFFDIFKDLTASQTDWELVTGALILRHIGQLIVNAHTNVSIVPQRSGMPYDPLYLPLFDATIWYRPLHVKAGFLHKFSDYDEVAAINFPYLSICNHACDPSFQPRFSGCFVSTYAAKDIAKGEEIFNCYTLDYRKSKKLNRQQALKDVYEFKCTCTKCERSDADIDYEQFHRYRCEHKECNMVFVPDLKNLRTLNWWDSVEGLPRGQFIKCTFCGTQQRCEWFSEFNELLKTDAVATDREELFRSYNKLSKWLMGYHEIKLMSAFQLVSDCYAAHNAGSPLSDYEFSKLAEILKFYLDGVAAQTRRNSVEYVVKLTFLWDFIALGKYKCLKSDMDDMLKSIEIVSDEFKTVFLNYYNDYLKATL